MLLRFVEKLRSTSYIDDGGGVRALPEWVVQAAAIGYWMRSSACSNNSILGFLVGPRRDYLGTFVSLGSVVAGAELFQPKLSWDQFISLDRDIEVHWEESGKRYVGTVTGSEDLDAVNKLIRVTISRSRKSSDKGSVAIFSRNRFEQCGFTLDRPQSSMRYERQLSALQNMSDCVLPMWLRQEVPEVLYVGKIANFEHCMQACTLVSGGGNRNTLEELLAPERGVARVVSKIKLEPAGKEISGSFPVVIQDGIRSYDPDTERNMIFLLDRTEIRSKVEEHLKFTEDKFAETTELMDAIGAKRSELEFCAFLM